MPHQTPTYFIGRIQLVSSILQGSFRLRISPELISPTASSASCTVRHAVVKLPAVRAFVRDELAPLLENTELLRAYTGLMVGG